MHYRVKGTDEVYAHVETVDDMVKLQLDENTVGWYHKDQIEPSGQAQQDIQAP